MESWAEASNFSLIHDAKLPKSFDSARWKRGYNSDVVFVSTRIASMCQRGVLDPIPRTQHRPITITIRSPVTATHCPFRRRFNVKKTNWSKFTNEIDQAIANIPAPPNHYNDFVDLVKKAARHNIPRQGSYRSWKVMEFDNLDSRPGKSWNFCPGPGKSWNFMLANLYAAELPTVLDCLTCMLGKTSNYGNM